MRTTNRVAQERLRSAKRHVQPAGVRFLYIYIYINNIYNIISILYICNRDNNVRPSGDVPVGRSISLFLFLAVCQGGGQKRTIISDPLDGHVKLGWVDPYPGTHDLAGDLLLA